MAGPSTTLLFATNLNALGILCTINYVQSYLSHVCVFVQKLCSPESFWEPSTHDNISFLRLLKTTYKTFSTVTVIFPPMGRQMSADKTRNDKCRQKTVCGKLNKGIKEVLNINFEIS